MKPTFDGFVEPKTDRRKLLLGLVFGSAAALAAWRRPTLQLDYLGRHKLADIVPENVGRWKFVTSSGLVVPPEDEMEKTLYSNVLTRVYSDGRGPPVMLLLAQNGSQTGFLQVHRPETCYSASGFQISEVVPHPISLGPRVVSANRMDASSGGSTEHVVYWTRVGNTIPGSWRAQKLAVAEQNLQGIIPDAILVRVSTVNNDDAAALASIDDFIRALLTSVEPRMRSVFIP